MAIELAPWTCQTELCMDTSDLYHLNHCLVVFFFSEISVCGIWQLKLNNVKLSGNCSPCCLDFAWINLCRVCVNCMLISCRSHYSNTPNICLHFSSALFFCRFSLNFCDSTTLLMSDFSFSENIS